MFLRRSVQNARWRRSIAQLGITALVAGVLPAVAIITAPAAGATEPQQVSFTLEGCRNDGSITLPNSSGQFVCPDSAYTTGNLGKGWNELDLVPYRVTASAGNSAPATQTYTFAIVVDNFDSGHPGYDVLSVPVLNTAVSAASCTAPTVGAATVLSPGLGGIDQSLYRLVTITQQRNTDCVYDYYARLALGSHLFPGSSLHANLANENLGISGVGSKDVSIPVREIAPQELNKDMTATQDSDHVWDIVKQPTPARVDFGNTCDPATPLSAPASVTVSWTKEPATPSGDITVVTHVYATNPASRTVTVNVTDVIRSGSTTLDTTTSGPVNVPANTNQMVLTHTTTVPAGTANLNDIATASYTDLVTGVSIPGTTTATASATVQPSGVDENNSAVINDVETLTGSNMAFSVDSFSGASGAFDGGYVAGTPTTGSVSWTSTSQSDSGSVTFSKTVYASAASVGTGSLSDVATLTGSDGFTTSASAGIDLSTNATTSLAVTKTTSLDLASAQTFTFHLFDATTDTATGDTTTVTIPALSNGPVTSSPITGLSATGSYYVREDANAPYPAQQSGTVTFSVTPGDLSSCSATITVHNQAGSATARVRKDTVPASSGNWTFTLSGPGGLSETLSNVQAGAGYLPFASALNVDGGTYTITETQQAGYDLSSVTGDVGGNAGRVTTSLASRTCSFTLNLSTDSGTVFECAYTNTQRGHARVVKTVNGAAPSGSQSFTFQLRQGASASAAGTILETGTANAADGGVINFATSLVPGTTYQLCEQLMPGWMTSLGPPFFTVYNPSGDNSVVCTDFTVTAGQTKTFAIDNTPPPGGRALTIGFWKNWASCAGSSGKQKPVLDQTLLAAALAGQPITIGTLVLDPRVLGAATACKDAVNLLNKTTIDGKKKMSSDPLFNMAAQLLAAELNVAAGAGVCANAVSAINQAQALLVKYHFNGQSYTPKLSSADATLANSLATALDKYNNNLLC